MDLDGSLHIDIQQDDLPLSAVYFAPRLGLPQQFQMRPIKIVVDLTVLDKAITGDVLSVANNTFSKPSFVTKKYSRPSISVGRGPRVVMLMLNSNNSGYFASRRPIMVPFSDD